jgi:3-(3-hydroxy-phenyl)propionate hydroxylase
MTIGPHYEVVIVGYGPVGAVAACWLGQMGIKTLVVEKSGNIWEIPRAIALDHEILRVFQNIGVVERVLPYTAPFGASEHFGAQGQLIRRIDVMAPPYPMGYLPNMVFTQPRVEAILRERASEHEQVSVHLGAEVTGLVEEDGGVAVNICRDDGSTQTIGTKYVIACDGASSMVRRRLNVSLEDLGFDEPWLVVDVLVNDEALAKLPPACAQYCDPDRPYTYIIGPGNHRRWEIMLNPGEDPRRVEREETIWQLLSRWLKPGDGRLWRASSYRFHALVAAQWRKGRVFLAGDAAHQQPPFIGQGMCQGIRDVTNLCWKLDAVLKSFSSDALLDTYEEERKQHVTTLTRRIMEIGASICIQDAEAARRRDEELLRQGGGRALFVTRQEIVPPLQSGLGGLDFGTAVGTLFPQPRIMTDTGSALLDDVTGTGWRLMVDGRCGDVLADMQRAGLKTVVIGNPGLEESDGVSASWFDRFGCQAAIVRPDHYVYCGLADARQAQSAWDELQNRIGAKGRPVEQPADGLGEAVTHPRHTVV